MAKTKRSTATAANSKRSTTTGGRDDENDITTRARRPANEAETAASAASAAASSLPSSLLLHTTRETTVAVTAETLIPGYVWVFHNFLTSDECNAWVQYIENRNNNNNNKKEKNLSLVQQRGTRYMAHRECYRLQLNDNDMSRSLYERTKTHRVVQQSKNNSKKTIHDYIVESLTEKRQQRQQQKQKQQPVGFNPNIRLYKYTKGMSFGSHVDESEWINEFGANTHSTVLIYLSNCHGGATRFQNPTPTPSATPGTKKTSGKTGSSCRNDETAFEPRIGTMLLHVHGDDCLVHEADPVT